VDAVIVGLALQFVQDGVVFGKDSDTSEPIENIPKVCRVAVDEEERRVEGHEP